MAKLDTLIINGRVFDAPQGIDRTMDVGIVDGRMVEPGPVRPEAVQVVDADGCWVFPGFIDFHVHAFGEGSGWGIARPDLLLATGVTSAVDAGSAGCVNYEAMRRCMILPSLVKMKTMLNVYSGGTLDIPFDEDLNPEKFNVKLMRRMLRDYRDEIIALKVRIPKSITRQYGMKPFYRALELAEEFAMPLCVHVTDPPCPQAEIAGALRKGDIVCHAFCTIISARNTGRTSCSCRK